MKYVIKIPLSLTLFFLVSNLLINQAYAINCSGDADPVSVGQALNITCANANPCASPVTLNICCTNDQTCSDFSHCYPSGAPATPDYSYIVTPQPSMSIGGTPYPCALQHPISFQPGDNDKVCQISAQDTSGATDEFNVGVGQGCLPNVQVTPVKSNCNVLQSLGLPTSAVNPTGDLYSGTLTGLGCIPNSPQYLALWLLKYVIPLTGGVGFLLLLGGAFSMMTAAGNPEKTAKAQQIITSVIAGLIFIIFGVYLINILGVKIIRIPGF